MRHVSLAKHRVVSETVINGKGIKQRYMENDQLCSSDEVTSKSKRIIVN